MFLTFARGKLLNLVKGQQLADLVRSVQVRPSSSSSPLRVVADTDTTVHEADPSGASAGSEPQDYSQDLLPAMRGSDDAMDHQL